MQPAIELPTHIGPRVFDVFFYGLYMDAEVLAASGVVPRAPRLAFIEDHSVRLGCKAVLQRDPGKRAYGMLFKLTHDEMDGLYEPTNGYSAEAFLAVPIVGNSSATPVAAISMVHRELPPNRKGDSDGEYGRRWMALTERLGIPVEHAIDTL